MAVKRQEDPPKGSPAWMNTFSDLMNLLLCFFVMLFAMSSVDEEKFQQVVASFQRTFSILPSGGASIGEGELISSGVSQLEMFGIYYEQMMEELEQQDSEQTEEEQDITEAYEAQALTESEEMAEQIEQAIEQYGIQDQVEVDFNAEYVILNMNGALRALTVADYLRDTTTVNPAYVKSSGRGDYVPIADNATPEGRARNRRVEIKIYNSYNSDLN